MKVTFIKLSYLAKASLLQFDGQMGILNVQQNGEKSVLFIAKHLFHKVIIFFLVIGV